MSRSISLDPRQVPVSQVDHHLPAVPHAHLQPAALQARFRHAPEWTPELAREPRFMDRPPAQAAVLIPIVTRDAVQGGPSVLLTERALHLPTHSGQIAFPGGKVDPEDRDVEATALREAQEEIGLHPQHVEIIGKMPQYITGSAFWITPVVALVDTHFVLNPNQGEVADVFEVPLSFLMNPAHHRLHHTEWQGEARSWLSMPYMELQTDATGQPQAIERYIWGATAGMLRNLYRFLMLQLPEGVLP